MAVTRYDWTVTLLRRLEAPFGNAQKRAVVAWTSAEGTAARWNPLATTKAMPGATNFNSVGVKNYTDWKQGLDATVGTLDDSGHGYEKIVDALRDKTSTAGEICRAVEASDWGTGGLILQVLEDVQLDIHRFGDQNIGQD